MTRDKRELDGYMFAHQYLVKELLKDNPPQDLKRQYVAKRQASNIERRNKSRKKLKSEKDRKR